MDRAPCRKRRRKRRSLLVPALFSVSATAAFAGNGNVPQVATALEVGMASWYGHPYHGRQAASGGIYDMHKLTAAHRTLPFGTRVRILNLENTKTVDVEINDRGPFIDGRLIDVSLAAADILGFHGTGSARVEIRVLPALEVTQVPGQHVAPAVLSPINRESPTSTEWRRKWPITTGLCLTGDMTPFFNDAGGYSGYRGKEAIMDDAAGMRCGKQLDLARCEIRESFLIVSTDMEEPDKERLILPC